MVTQGFPGVSCTSSLKQTLQSYQQPYPMGPIGLIGSTGSTGSIGTRAHGSTSGRRWDVRFRELQAEAWPPRTGLGPRKESAAGLGPENGGFTYTDTQTLRPPENIEKNRHFRGKMKRWLIDGIGFRACPIFREPTQISFRFGADHRCGSPFRLPLDSRHMWKWWGRYDTTTTDHCWTHMPIRA